MNANHRCAVRDDSQNTTILWKLRLALAALGCGHLPQRQISPTNPPERLDWTRQPSGRLTKGRERSLREANLVFHNNVQNAKVAQHRIWRRFADG